MKLDPRLIIDFKDTIIHALKRMDEVGRKMLLIFKDDTFFSILTIGDLQRAIIANKDLKSSVGGVVDKSTKIYCKPSDTIDEIKSKMQEIRAEMMPIVDDIGNLVNIYFWGDFFPEEQRDFVRFKLNLPVVIMAGGFGTRLKPLTNVFPKPLIPIGEKTILEVILDQFEKVGCEKFYLSVNYKDEMIRYYMSNLKHKYDILYFKEDKPLGTIGSVRLIKEHLKSAFFVSNCDILIDQDYRDIYEYHKNNNNDITLVTSVKSFTIPYGVIESGRNGLLETLTEKPEYEYMINTGVYLLNPEVINLIPEGRQYHITHLIDRVKNEGGRIGCFPLSENAWIDMGNWEDYNKIIRRNG